MIIYRSFFIYEFVYIMLVWLYFTFVLGQQMCALVKFIYLLTGYTKNIINKCKFSK
jgi:hypothetical protein